MVKVSVSDQDAVHAFESQTGIKDLALGPFSAINQEAELIMQYDLGG
jgi:hypothetical protein